MATRVCLDISLVGLCTLYNEMKKAFQQTAFILLRELLWRCFGYKIDWRRLFLLVAILTVSGIVSQMLVHSHLPNNWFLSHETDSSYQSLNSSIQSNEFIKEARRPQIHLILPNPVISHNSSNKLVQSVSVEPEIVVAQQRNNSISGSRKYKKHAETTKIVASSPPSGLVPSHKQVEVVETLNLLLFISMMRRGVTNNFMDIYLRDICDCCHLVRPLCMQGKRLTVPLQLMKILISILLYLGMFLFSKGT